MDEYTEVTRQGWFSRIGESIKGVLVGLVLFLVSFPLLWLNEGRAVRTARSLEEGAGAVISVSADKVDPANESKLVHLSALAQTTDLVSDPEFGVEQKAIKLVRTSEMYQWVETQKTETQKKLGGSEEKKTVYRYEKQWASKVNDSGEFKIPAGHSNPPIKYPERTDTAKNVTVGAFSLPPAMLNDLAQSTPLTLDASALAKASPEVQRIGTLHDGSFYLRPDASSASFDATAPEVGDLRVRFSVVPAAVVSLVAQQQGNSFAPYQTKAGDPISMIKTGTLTAAQMFSSATDANETLTWILRLVGFLCMLFGAGLMLRPLVVVADVVPLIGSLLGLSTFLVSFAVAIPLSAATIAIAWVVVRPVIGVAMLVGALAVLVGAVVLGRKRRRARTATARA